MNNPMKKDVQQANIGSSESQRVPEKASEKDKKRDNDPVAAPFVCCCGMVGLYGTIGLIVFLLVAAGAAAAAAVVLLPQSDSPGSSSPIEVAWGSSSCSMTNTSACGEGECTAMRPDASGSSESACLCPPGKFGTGCSQGTTLDEAAISGLTNGTHFVPLLTRAEVFVQPSLEVQIELPCDPTDATTQTELQESWV